MLTKYVKYGIIKKSLRIYEDLIMSGKSYKKATGYAVYNIERKTETSLLYASPIVDSRPLSFYGQIICICNWFNIVCMVLPG